MCPLYGVNADVKNNAIVRKTALYKYFRKDKLAFDVDLEDSYERPPDDSLLVARLTKAEQIRKKKEIRHISMLFLAMIIISVATILFFDNVVDFLQDRGWFDYALRHKVI